MKGFPELYSRRLTLRKLESEDLPLLVRYANNKKISDHIINIPYPYREPDAAFRISYVVQGFKNKSRYVFAITLDEIEEFIGEISLNLSPNASIAELGYWIAEPFWNKGYGTEAIQTLLKYGFEKLELDAIHASCHVNNKSSEKVLLKNSLKKNSVKGNVIQFVISEEQFSNK